MTGFRLTTQGYSSTVSEVGTRLIQSDLLRGSLNFIVLLFTEKQLNEGSYGHVTKQCVMHDSAYSVGKFEPDYSHEGPLLYATGWVTVLKTKFKKKETMPILPN